jgi:hypothetical protein
VTQYIVNGFEFVQIYIKQRDSGFWSRWRHEHGFQALEKIAAVGKVGERIVSYQVVSVEPRLCFGISRMGCMNEVAYKNMGWANGGDSWHLVDRPGVGLDGGKCPGQ